MVNTVVKNVKSDQPTRSSGIKNAILIFPIIAIIGAVWLILVNLEELPESLTMGQDFKTWLNLWILIFVISIVILICIPQSGETTSTRSSQVNQKTSTKPEPKPKMTALEPKDTQESEEKPIEFKPITKAEAKNTAPDIMSSAVASGSGSGAGLDKSATTGSGSAAQSTGSGAVKPRMFEYPLDVEGGLYGDTFIDIDDKSVLKLRTLVVNDIYLL